MDTKVPKTRQLGDLRSPVLDPQLELGPAHPGAWPHVRRFRAPRRFRPAAQLPARRAPAQALEELRMRRAAPLRREQHPLCQRHQDRRVGARQALPFRAARRRRGADRLGLRLGRHPSQILLRLACAGELPRRHARHARHRAARGRADEEPRRGDHGACFGRPASPTCRSASISPRRRCSSNCRRRE